MFLEVSEIWKILLKFTKLLPHWYSDLPCTNILHIHSAIIVDPFINLVNITENYMLAIHKGNGR